MTGRGVSAAWPTPAQRAQGDQPGRTSASGPPIALHGDDREVPCADGVQRRYLSLDAAASTAALPAVVDRVTAFLPWYSSIHRGAGAKSQRATAAYEAARDAALVFAGRAGRDDVAILCRNTTEAINHLAYRLRLAPDDVVVTSVVEHHANLLPWTRAATCRYVECASDGTFTAADVEAALDATPRPRLLALTGASNITGWLPPVAEITAAAHARGVPILLDGAQLAPHRPLPAEVDYVAWSGHKMYAPFGTGVLIGPRATFLDGDPFLAGGGAVDLVDLDEVLWSDPPEREEAGSPNVVGAVALHAAMDTLTGVGWDHIVAHDRRIARRLRSGVAATAGVRLLGPALDVETLPVATFTLAGVPHALLAARLAAEDAIGVRHGCFCAHPYLVRLLGLTLAELHQYREEVRRRDRRGMPGAVRASAGINTSEADVDRFLAALAEIAAGARVPPDYRQDPVTGDYAPVPPGSATDSDGLGTALASGSGARLGGGAGAGRRSGCGPG